MKPARSSWPSSGHDQISTQPSGYNPTKMSFIRHADQGEMDMCRTMCLGPELRVARLNGQA
jgi:hypothetical protein